MRRSALALPLLLLSACTPLPDSYPVPPQRTQGDAPDPEPMGSMVSFSKGNGPQHIISDFLNGPPDQLWRWTGEKPVVRVILKDTSNLRMRVGFAFPDQSHKPLLPITVRYYVNNHLLDTVVYKQSGVLEFRKAVPAEWLQPGPENYLGCIISPVYVAEGDGTKLAMVISEIGLEKND
ncbi:MAG TPA: hypothetical protein VFQ91_21900 [Bryobacteraceae bacterium]|nr:hypothetical protein [Bryobacteraceae bacterium]